MQNVTRWGGALHALVACGLLATAPAAEAQTSTLPAGWTSRDVGGPALPGSAAESAGTFTVRGAGRDIWDTSDEFQFVYRPVSGDTQIVAYVANLRMVDQYSKAGVMIRSSLSGSSPNAYARVTQANGWQFNRRLTSGGTTFGGGATPTHGPGWVRLVREGSMFSAYISQDGSNWTMLGTDMLTMPATVYVGLAVGSKNTSATASATFSNVSISAPTAANTPPTVGLSGPASGATFTAPASVAIAATAGDVDGSVSQVDFYAGTQLLRSDTASPYTATWSSVAAGSYSLTAVATDNLGAKTTSAAVAITVVAAPVSTPSTLALVPPKDYATNVTSISVQLRRSTDAVSATPVATRNLGKPAVVSGEISVDISTLVDPLAAGSYYAVVVTTGPGGSTPSTPSAAFSK